MTSIKTIDRQKKNKYILQLYPKLTTSTVPQTAGYIQEVIGIALTSSIYKLLTLTACCVVEIAWITGFTGARTNIQHTCFHWIKINWTSTLTFCQGHESIPIATTTTIGEELTPFASMVEIMTGELTSARTNCHWKSAERHC
jgi:hypothetical protein